jgi:putative transposase
MRPGTLTYRRLCPPASDLLPQNSTSDKERVEEEAQMRSSRYSEDQIIGILKEVQAGKSAREVIRHYGIAEATFYRWRERYAGVELAEARRMAQLEQENRRLKQMVAELSLDKEVLKSVIAKNGLRR